jgi:hypothetical protein
MKTFNAKPQRTQRAPGNSQTGVSLGSSASLRLCVENKNQGVALIITLILLAVVTVMAVAFLASSRRERGAVTTTTDTAGARLAADAALAQAEAQIMANVLATTNPYNFGLVVSTNYLPNTGNTLSDLTNMLISPRAPVWLSNNITHALENRFYLDLNRNGADDPNGWVTNVNNLGSVILNGDGSPSTNFQVGDPEWIGVLDHPDQPYGPNNQFIARYAFVAVPIGNALDLNAIHNQVFNNNSPLGVNDGFVRNEGIGSWEINLAAFLADLNANEWGQNIGNATWYQYNQANTSPFANSGNAFDDARALLAYRYNNNYNSLFSLQRLYGANGYSTYANGVVDSYTLGKLMTNTFLPFLNAAPNNTPWAGADNTNHFFDMQDLFDPAKTSGGPNGGFTNRLLNAGNGTSTYDRYTFYRLLSQLGTDSAPEQNKMNLNYDNIDHGFNGFLNANGTASATNFVPWTAIGFFTNAADKMLRAYSQDWLTRDPASYLATYQMTTNIGTLISPTNIPVSFGITDIPVLVSNQFVYSSAIQRVLQLAANIYDATTNNTAVMGRNYPSVFRPIFWVTNENGFRDVFITNYEQIVSSAQPDNPLAQPVDVTSNIVGSATRVNVYGVPWIIGAKKGFPNFNEFSMENVMWIERKLQIYRPGVNAQESLWQTNQMYVMSISNSVGVECWNSYSANYIPLGSLRITVRDTISTVLSNLTTGALQPIAGTIQPNIYTINSPVTPAFWPGTVQPWTNNTPNSNSFIIPLNTTIPFFTNEVCASPTGPFVFQSALGSNWNTGIFPLPQLGLAITNRLQMFILDGRNVIDYVQFGGPNSRTNLNSIIADYNPTKPSAGFWNTNLFSAGTPFGIPNGVNDQILYSENPKLEKPFVVLPNDDITWVNPPGSTVGQEIASFNAFLSPNHIGTGTDPNTGVSYKSTNLDLIVQVPFTPSRYVYGYTSWQANDPLVHYVASDLNFSGNESSGLETGWHVWPSSTTNLPPNNLGLLNDRYQPWGISTQMRAAAGVDSNPDNLAFKDPLIYSSDDWDFPAYKLPTAGWLGRVHRGTPWQTVYLKSGDVLKENAGINTWMVWTGNTNAVADAVNAGPVQDRLLFDLFSTAPNDNATRGQLSVNVGANDPNNPQAGLAAWSALFSGIMGLSNNTNTDFLIESNQFVFPRFALSTTASPIQPAGAAGINSPVLGQIVAGINQTRANFTNADGLAGTFEHAGDILSVPQLTEQSTNLNRTDPIQLTNGINDEMYEWLPQQTMSLLRAADSPRYVIYCYGQTLKPAQNSILTSGGSGVFGMSTNYQVVSETATRAIVRFDSTRINNIYPPNDNNAPIFTNIWINVPSVTSNNAVIESFNVLPPD